MSCDERGQFVRCTTPENADIRIRRSAIGDYTASAANSFSESHDLGPDPYEKNRPHGDDEPAPQNRQPNDDSGCEPGYDPCLQAGVGDYDCDGGYGNGPNYTGRVDVFGSDPFDLDRDRDGVGCE